MSEEFVEQYVDSCFDEGIVKPDDICKKALDDIAELDNQLEEYKTLRIRRNNLIQVLRAFNHEEGKSRGRRARAPMINPEVTDVDHDPSYKDVLVDICNAISEYNRPVTMREVIIKSKYDTEDTTPLYQAMKWLFNQGIVKRNEDRSVEPGPKWNDRPQNDKVVREAS